MKEDIALLFRKLTHGVYSIGVADNGQYNAFTAAWVMHVSFNPLVLAISVNPNHSSLINTLLETTKNKNPAIKILPSLAMKS